MQQIEAWTLIPFAIMLLVIAIAPLIIEERWEKNINKMICVLVLSIPTAWHISAWAKR